MKKTTISITFEDEKLGALEFSLKKENSSVQERMEDAIEKLYEQTVPEPVREYLDSKSALATSKPKRPVKPSASRHKPDPAKPSPTVLGQ